MADDADAPRRTADPPPGPPDVPDEEIFVVWPFLVVVPLGVLGCVALQHADPALARAWTHWVEAVYNRLP
ncbi:MAG: hypothetical protein K6V97_11160 [Actinomycetia bacterium]|nr:hypothetical protein [Actinomycetes bacterium]